jgi:hypothetical protein
VTSPPPVATSGTVAILCRVPTAASQPTVLFREPIMTFRTIAMALAAGLILAACSSSTTTTNPPPAPPPAPPPPPPPPGSEHLYLGQDDIPGKILVYNLPLTSSSTPVVMVPYDADVSLSVNATTLAANRLSDYTVSFFQLPLTSASIPYATIPVGLLESPLFLPTGALYLSAPDTINVYTPPFTSASTSTGRVLTPNLTAHGLAIDPNGTVYAANATQIDVITGGAVITTLTAAPGTEFDALAASATQLFACEGTGFASHVFIYSLPLTATATPSVIMNSGTVGIGGCALDASGNLYISWGPTVVVFAPPFTSTSTSTLSLSINGGASGIAIGP